VNSQKIRSILLVCFAFILWYLIDTIIWLFQDPQQYLLILKYNASLVAAGLIISMLLMLLQWKIIGIAASRPFVLVLVASVSTIPFAFMLSLTKIALTSYWRNTPFLIRMPALLQGTFISLILFLALTGLFYVVYYRNISIQQKEQLAHVKALADEAQLLMLRYQINPHFLFNSLNAIQSMIEKDKDRAKDMIADLSDFFRYTLSKNAQTLVPFKEEMDAIQNYLAIQKARFAGRLEIVYDIDPSSLNMMLPFFIIHPLVENAIKYGFSANADILHLLIKVTHEKETLVILVKNSGTLVLSDQNNRKDVGSTKTGIENIKKRLALYYPDCSSFELLEQKGSVHALITITHPSMAI